MKLRFSDTFMAVLILFFGICLVMLILWAATATAYAADANITWSHPTQRVDNTALPLSDIKETQIDYATCTAGTFPATPLGTKTVAAPAASAVISGLGYGVWCFRARTVDTSGLQSENSTVVSKQYLAPPKPPTLSAVITIVYEIQQNPNGVRLAREVGAVPLGTRCLPQPIATDRGVYYEVPIDVVTLAKMPKSAIVVTQCEVI